MPLEENGSSDTSSGQTHEHPLSDFENTKASQEARLFHSLNGFISLVSNESSRSGENPARHNGFEDSKFDSKYLSNFLRLNLLSYLRQLQQYTHRQTSHRQVLIQWWVTLLNFLNSDIVMNSPNSEADSRLSFPDPRLNMDTISVSLECVSRLMSTLMVLPIDDYRETEIYSHHVLLTIHYVTNRLILNSKHSNHLGKVQPPNNRPFLHFLNSYTTLLRSFLGKLNAYAFFYLPDDFHYDTQLLMSVIPKLTIEVCSNSLFPWKRRSFETAEETDGCVNPDDLENKDTRFFKIVISYMRNDTIFMAFYWHYWYIVLRFISFSETGSNIESSLSIISGASPLMTHVTSSYLRTDLNRLMKFLKSAHLSKVSPNSNFNSSDTMPDAAASPAAANTNDSTVTTEMFNDFVFSNFGILRLWECLRCLSGCFLKDPNLPLLLSLHDSFQLSYISSIPAYDCNAANVVYNKILQFIIFQYRSIPSVQFLHWDLWSLGILGMLKTLSSNCQVTALMCLFNIWDFVPSFIQKELTSRLVKDLWSSLTLENEFELSKVIFLKLLVFRIIPTSDYSIREALKIKFQDLHEEMLSHKAYIGEKSYMENGDVFAFYGNKRFVLSPNKPTKEEDLIYRVEKQSRLRVKTKSQNFPSVTSVANIRPSFILKNGRYPYDVFDEMVTKAALLLAEKKRKESESPLPAVRDPTSSIAEQTNRGVERNPKRLSSLSNTIGSWFSKLSMDSDQASSSSESSKHTSGGIMNMRKKRVKSATSDVNLPASESTEILSMYSNVSSLATGITSSSDDVKSNKQLSGSSSRASAHGEASSGDAKLRNEQLKKKKKLLAPVELKYSIGVIDGTQISTLFKVMIISTESILNKIEKANVSWSVTTARSYKKPLPIPGDPGVDSFIEEINSDSFDFETFNESKFEFQNLQQTTEPPINLRNSSANTPTIPIPNYSILGNESDKELLIGASSSPVGCYNPDIDEMAQKTAAPLRYPGQDTSEDHEAMARQFVLKHNKMMHLNTRINKMGQLVRMFNKTVEEYYEYLNFLDHEFLFMEFEVRIPTHSLNLMNIEGEK